MSWVRWLLLLLLSAPSFNSMILHASEGSLERELRNAYQGRVLTLRHFYDGDKLHFRADGQLIGDSATGPWTLDGQLKVTDIHLDRASLQIVGKRLTLVSDPASKRLRDLLEISPTRSITLGDIFHGGKRQERAREIRMLSVDLDLVAAPQGMTEVESVMNLVFLAPNDDTADFVPEFWKDFVLQQEGKPVPVAPADGEPVYKSADLKTPPRVIYQPDPEYSEEAREAGYFGDAVLSIIVNAQGSVRDIKILKAASLGLDERAVDVVTQWRFDRKDGVPVAVRLEVSVSWRLY
jgi:TonB family protein